MKKWKRLEEKQIKILMAIVTIIIVVVGTLTIFFLLRETEVTQEIEEEIEMEEPEEVVEEEPTEIEEPVVEIVEPPPVVRNQDQIVGREEQETSAQQVNPEERAVELARQAWGENNEAYTFIVANTIDANTYVVEVRSVSPSGSMVIGYFEVNTTTETIKER